MVCDAATAVLVFIIHRMYERVMYIHVHIHMSVCLRSIHSHVTHFVMLYGLPGDPGTLTW